MRKMMCLLAAVCAAGAFAAEVPTAEALKVDSPPKLDGKLDEPFWRTAKAYGDFYVYEGGGKRTDVSTFKVAFDDAWLYLGITCKNPKLSVVRPLIKGHDKGACNDDSVEIFFDPGTDGKAYYHYMLGWGGAKDERRVVGQTKELDWDIPWRAATDIGKDGWTAEIALPLYLIPTYGAFDKTRLNIARNERLPVVDNCAVVVREDQRHSTWSEVIKSFHEPNRFGKLAMTPPATPKIPVLAAIEDIRVKPYYREDGKTFYDAVFAIRGFTDQSGSGVVSLIDKPMSGKTVTVEKTVSIQGTAPRAMTLAVPVESMADRQVSIALKDLVSGETLQLTDVEDLSALKVMSAYLDRNYYTTETIAKAVCALGLPKEALASATLVAKNAEGKVIGRVDRVIAETEIPVAMAAIPVGERALKIELLNGGETVFSLPLTLIKRAPKPGREWKIDKINRVVLNNGEPFFAMGFCVDALNLSQYREVRDKLAAAGFNFLMNWSQLERPEELKAYGDMFKDSGVYLMPAVDDIVCNDVPDVPEFSRYVSWNKIPGHAKYQTMTATKGVMCYPPFDRLPRSVRNEAFGAFFEKKLPDILTAVKAAKDSPSISTWFIFDEPQLQVFDQWIMGRKLYEAINAVDGYHPILVNYSSHIPDGENAVNWMDILCTDPYWVPAGTDRSRATPNFVSTIVCRTRARALENRQPVFTVPLAPIWSGTRKRLITPEEQYCQTYLAAIHGAAGIVYFAYRNIHDKATWDSVCRMAEEFKILGPACVAPAVKQTLVYKKKETDGSLKDVVCDPANEKFADIQVSLKRGPSGGYILMAANSRYYPVGAEIKVVGLKQSVQALFSQKAFAVDAGQFLDAFEAFGTRAYRIAETLPEPVTIEVIATPPPTIPAPELEVPYCWRGDRKNEFCNPSFEEESVPGIPDYVSPAFYEGKRVGPYVGEPGAVWGLDRSEVKFGAKSLRIKYPATDGNKTGVFFMPCAPQNDKPSPYVFSLWMKGDRKNMNVTLCARGFTGEKYKGVNVSDRWERYWFAGELPAMASPYTVFNIWLGSEGTVWVDGLQLEKGSVPTEFEE